MQYLKKGSRVLIEGSNLEAAAYTSKKDNQPRARLEMTADRVVYLDRAPESDNDEPQVGDIPF